VPLAQLVKVIEEELVVCIVETIQAEVAEVLEHRAAMELITL
jgi:hypothetical protein